jgi:hypothetical protein
MRVPNLFQIHRKRLILLVRAQGNGTISALPMALEKVGTT